MNLGTVVLGVLNGMTVGLLAVGLVLVYKSNRFINLAHAQMGTLSALLLAKWVLDWGWGWWLAFALAVGVGLLTGLAVERLLVRRLRRRTSSPVALLLLSVGASQLLLALTYIPSLGPSSDHAGLFPQPFGTHLRIGGVVLSGMSLLTMALVPVLVVGLAIFFRYSLLGKQIRAAASNADAARLCGVSVSRVSAVTWGLAGSLAAVSAVLAAPTQPSFNIGALGPYLLMFTLGAAAFGAFVSLPAALAGGVVLGVIGQLVSAQTGSAAQGELAVFAAILFIILFRGRAISAVFAVTGAAVEDQVVTRVPSALRTSLTVRYQRWWLTGAAVLVAVLVPQLPYFHTRGHRFLLVLVVVYALVGVALTMLIGWAGQVSLGHFALVGVGAFMTARLSAQGWSLPAILLVIGATGAVVMALVGLPALRVPGLTLAVTTLGFGVIASDWLFRQSWLASASSFGSTVKPARLASGLGTPRTELSIYYVALAVLVLVGAAGSALRRSAPGRLVVAVRDNERASAAFGVTPATVKLGILAVSGFVAAAGGVLWAEAWGVASPSQFSADVSVSVLAVPVIGGLGSLGGAVAAAVVLYGSTFFIGPSFNAVFGRFGQNLGFQLFLAGVLLIGTMLRFPKGLAGVAQASWQRFLDRRSARVRSSWDRSAADLPLQMSEVRVHFGGVTALDGPEIIVRPGEIVGLIGPNGAGKTTLMNVISGVITPDAGSVRLFGHEVVDLPPDLRAAYGLARSFQDATLFPGLTVTETVQVALGRGHKIGVIPAMLGAPWVRSRERTSLRQANEIVERFGLAAWAQVMTSELSTGTRRICDLAAQVAAEPKLLMLDEPTAGVAQRDAEAFGPLLRQIRDELDCSVLIVEHDMPLLMGLCDRVYAMEAGRVIAEGTPAQIRNDPAVVASYLGNETVAITRSGARKPRPASTNGSSSNSSKKGASDSRTTGSSGSTRRRSS